MYARAGWRKWEDATVHRFQITFLEDSIRLKLLVQQIADMENLRTLQRRMKNNDSRYHIHDS